MNLDYFIQIIGGYIETYGYLAVFLLALLENSIFLGLVIPGETFVILAGFYAAQGRLSLTLVIFLALLGGILGGQLGYLLGREGEKRLLYKYKDHLNINEKYKAVKKFMKMHGNKTIFFARFTAFLRAIAPFVAGTLKMPYLKFTFWDVLGAFVWSITIPILGYYFGQNYKVLHQYLGDVGVILIVVLVILVWINLRRKAVDEDFERNSK
ncbi:TPA: hypothetical protein DDW69_04370 [candidate division CPR2 bacterium]|uniref:VTT domain-containing protein n=1 Tax=candidate division CPR2 bacterium GW2011_GWC1_41_48 TaxID=1618344 RepID=A0A0G0YIB5_UNCC2|nr:MAG: hypothetical protein UT47_C0002G0245 [candidate division CPR2 bacterium GW2011_GWC2_39_35]KKR27346.1 MAG: hypothetical protein UT59_C0060G0006 [candidate division CPR2 bacterium GW2011_GWD1_39_7]KKR29104.1 MAG: hypothetical protein UT60_C0007G0049 [candidate division CPR2 bacterium GW2011_GWD2_39_7]KKS09281.1 MAG: hypothetical protein UU65_C0002G0059 [candidate division CPR2 bacterium GW2011_GWC1_41_48]OGB70590.1 MAG: hypothetical protein A2Y26_04610 [candidate division CPR2 bacterium G